MNNHSFFDIVNRLTLLALSRFEWQGLPEEIPERFLESVLHHHGRICFFKKPLLDKYIIMRYNSIAPLNIYNEPIRVHAFASNGETEMLENGTYVPIRNNAVETPTAPTLRMFATRLNNMERTIDVNLAAQKTPVMFITDNKKRLTIENLIMQYDGWRPFIITDEKLDIESVKVLNTNAPYIVDNLMSSKRNLYNECLTFLGIENANTDKRERMISGEVEGSKGVVEMNRYAFLNARRTAAEQINQMFGLNVQVYYRSNMDTLVNIATRGIFEPVRPVDQTPITDQQPEHQREGV